MAYIVCGCYRISSHNRIIITHICSLCHPDQSLSGQFSLAQPQTHPEKQSNYNKNEETSTVFCYYKISEEDHFLTWPTSAGAIVEFMCSTAWETPVTETSVTSHYEQTL